MFSNNLFKNVSNITLINFLILFFGFSREIVFVYKLGISDLSDNFFFYYLLIEDFNAIIYTGLLFGLVSYFSGKNLSPSSVKYLVNSLSFKIFKIIPLLVFIHTILFLSSNNYEFLQIRFFTIITIPFSIINGLLMSYLIYESKIGIAIFSRAINYFSIIIFMAIIKIPHDYNYLGIVIFMGYLIQLIYLKLIISLDMEKIRNIPYDSKNILKNQYQWILAPVFVPFLSNLIFRLIFVDDPNNIISAVNYASKIITLIGAFTFSVILVGFQDINLKKKKGSIDEIKKDIKNNITLLSIVLIPLSFFISILSLDLINLLFLRGNFSQSDAIISADILSILIYSVFPATLYGYLVRIYGSFSQNRNFLLFYIFLFLLSSISLLILYKIGMELIAFPVSLILSNSILSIFVYLGLSKFFDGLQKYYLIFTLLLNFLLAFCTFIQ